MSNRTSPFGTLVIHELRLHGKAYVLLVASTLALLWVATTFVSRSDGGRFAMAFQLALFPSLLWGDWLVGRERTTGTITWLRTLPIRSHAIVLAKFAVGASWSGVQWLLVSLWFAPELWRPVSTGVVLLSVIVCFGGLQIAGRWRFHWRIALVGPLLLLLVPVLLFTSLSGESSTWREVLLAWWTAPWGRPLAAVCVLSGYVAIVALTSWWVGRAETYQLVD